MLVVACHSAGRVARTQSAVVAAAGLGNQLVAAVGSSGIAAVAGIGLAEAAAVGIRSPAVVLLLLPDSRCTAAASAPGRILVVARHTGAAGRTAIADRTAARQVEHRVRRRGRMKNRRTLSMSSSSTCAKDETRTGRRDEISKSFASGVADF